MFIMMKILKLVLLILKLVLLILQLVLLVKLVLSFTCGSHDCINLNQLALIILLLVLSIMNVSGYIKYHDINLSISVLESINTVLYILL